MPAPLLALLRALAVWLLIMAGETLNGALRRLLFSADVIFAMRQVSVVVGVLIVFAVSWLCVPWLRLRTTRSALAVGALWIVLTLVFEVSIGRLTGLSWSQMLAEYDLTRGGIMPLGLLAMGLAPWLVQRLRAAPRTIGKTP